MIEWIKPTKGGRAGSAAYVSVSVTTAGMKNLKNRKNQLVLRFGKDACTDLRLISGDRIVIGLDKSTQEVCFKRTTDTTGYKLTGKSTTSLVVQATMDAPMMIAQPVEKSQVKFEGTHVAIKCPSLFK